MVFRTRVTRSALTLYKSIAVIKFFKYIFGFVAVVAMLLLLLLMSMRLDGVKHRLASFVSIEITDRYGIPFNVETVEVRGLNDVRLGNVTLFGLDGDTIVHTSEARAYLQTKRLLKGQIRVNTLVFAAPDIRLYRQTPDDVLNIQYLLDIINSKEKNEESRIDLRINQLLVYDGRFSYDVYSEAHDELRFDPNHILVTDFACNVSLKKLAGKEIDLYIRSISGEERCGLGLERFRARITGDGNKFTLKGVELRTPSSVIVSDGIEVNADSSWHNAVIAGSVESGFFSIDDIAPFVKFSVAGAPPLTFSINGSGGRDSVSAALSVSALDYSFVTRANIAVANLFAEQRSGVLDVEECFVDEAASNVLAAMAGIEFREGGLPNRVGAVSLKGDASFNNEGVKAKALLECEAGILLLDGSLAAAGRYALRLNARELDLGALAGIDGFNGGELKLKATGNIRDRRNYADVKGSILNLVYNGYHYSPIDFSSRLTSDAVTASVVSNDPNAGMQLTAKYGLSGERVLKFLLKADNLAPASLNLVKEGLKQDYAFELNGEYFDYGGGKTVANAKIDNLFMRADDDTTFVRNFYVTDNKAGDIRRFMITSDFATASITGNFDFGEILSSLVATLKSHLPVLDIASGKSFSRSLDNDFYYEVSITDSSPLTRMLNLPVTVLEPSVIRGFFNEHEKVYSIDASINRINLNGGLIRSLNVVGQSSLKGVDLNVQFTKPMVKNMKNFDYNNFEEDIVVRLNVSAASNKIKGIVNWNNFKSDDIMVGTVRMDAALSRNQEQELELAAKIYSDSVTHKNKAWYINEGTVSGRMDKLYVKNVGLSSDRQDLRIEGVIGREQSDSLVARLMNVDVATVFDIIKFRILDFGGKATGTAYLRGLLSAPNVGGRLDVSDFSIDGAILGRGDVYVGWEDDTKSIVLDAGVYNSQNEKTTVKGYLSQPNDTITLMVDANNVNAAFIGKKLGAFLSDIDGSGSGKVHVHGKWRSVDLQGAVALYCSAKVNANNTRYYLSGDSVCFSKGLVSFDNVKVNDRYGNEGSLSGFLTHKNLGRWTCNFNIKAREMLVYDTYDFGTLPFYGTIFGTGDAVIRSDSTGFLLRTNNFKSTSGSRFVYDTNEASGARDNSFVTFTDSSKRKKKEPQVEKPKSDSYNKTTNKLTLDFMFDVNEALEVKVYTNRQTDDYVSIFGNGPINAVYSDKDGFSMKGHLSLVRGAYKFTIQDIFPKVFEISKGSTIAFNGDPYRAELDLRAKYFVPSASLSDLTTEIAKRKTVKVNCLMNITGSLASPDLAFDLELPEGSEEERELLASVASTPDQKNMQFVYLLGVGKFYTFDANSAQADATNSTTAVESLMFNTISGQLNNMLGKIINNGNWDISGNISTSERGWNSMEVEGMLRGRLLDNRLQINGNLGYRENPIANRNFIGDFELLWLLSPNYNWNIKAYSKTNDRYFSKTDLTTQGVGTSILFEFDRWKWWGKKKKRKESTELVDVEVNETVEATAVTESSAVEGKE